MNFVLTKDQETLEKGLTILLEEHGHAYGEGEISITPVFTEENNKIWRRIEKGELSIDDLYYVRWQPILGHLVLEAD